MSLLSTLRPLSSRLQDNFGWILAYLPFSGQRETSFNHLSDDCILLLLEYFSLPELLALRSVSRRLCYLIEHYRLPQYKTLLYGYTKAERKGREDDQCNFDDQEVQVYVSTHYHVYTEFTQLKVSSFSLPRRANLCDHSSSPRGGVFSLKLRAFPPSLPSLLPSLASLSFSHTLANQETILMNYQMDGGSSFLRHVTRKEAPLSAEASTVNDTLAHYLRSSWADTLVSLHLYIQTPSKPKPDMAFFERLNNLPHLKHLYLELSHHVSPFHSDDPTVPNLLPDTLPVLSQLLSFSLTNYSGRNIGRFLGQLSPTLVHLTLWDTSLASTEYRDFLASRPTYAQTLKTLEFISHGLHYRNPTSAAYQDIFTFTTAHLHSLERLVLNFYSRYADIVRYFTALTRLPNLGDFSCVGLYLDQFRAYLEPTRMHPNRRPLPRLRAIHRVTIHLLSVDTEESRVESELRDIVLPLLAGVFCNLYTLDLTFSKRKKVEGLLPITEPEDYSETHSLQLLSWVNQHFKGLRKCKVSYFL